MYVIPVLNHVPEAFRDDKDTIDMAKRAHHCDRCKKDGLITIKGDVHCMECGNEIDLCKDCAKLLVESILEVIK